MSRSPRETLLRFLGAAGLPLLAIIIVAWAVAMMPVAAKPRAIALNIDECATCGMRISVEPWAAEAIAADGRIETFDSPACLASYCRAQAGPWRLLAVRVQDGLQWMEARSAWYVIGSRGGPMDDAPAAYSTEAAATTAAKAGGKVVRFDRLNSAVPKAAEPVGQPARAKGDPP